MLEVNNFNKVRELLKWDADGSSVYLVWLVMRNKDGNTQAKGNNKNRTIKTYFFQDKEHFDTREDEIIKLCKLFNCRAYICINKKPLSNILFELSNNVNERIKQLFNGNYTGLNGIVDSAVMRSGTSGEKLWVVDVDTKDEKYLDEVTVIVESQKSEYSQVIVDAVPTANGVHLITHPFNISTYHKAFEKNKSLIEPEIKKEGLTLLYASLNK